MRPWQVRWPVRFSTTYQHSSYIPAASTSVFGHASPREGFFAHWHLRRHRGASWRHRSESHSIPVIPILTEFRPILGRLGPVHGDTIGASSGALSGLSGSHEGRGSSDCTLPGTSFIPHHIHLILIKKRIKESIPHPSIIAIRRTSFESSFSIRDDRRVDVTWTSLGSSTH